MFSWPQYVAQNFVRNIIVFLANGCGHKDCKIKPDAYNVLQVNYQERKGVLMQPVDVDEVKVIG